jgi:hypothetical protein
MLHRVTAKHLWIVVFGLLVLLAWRSGRSHGLRDGDDAVPDGDGNHDRPARRKRVIRRARTPPPAPTFAPLRTLAPFDEDAHLDVDKDDDHDRKHDPRRLQDADGDDAHVHERGVVREIARRHRGDEEVAALNHAHDNGVAGEQHIRDDHDEQHDPHGNAAVEEAKQADRRQGEQRVNAHMLPGHGADAEQRQERQHKRDHVDPEDDAVVEHENGNGDDDDGARGLRGARQAFDEAGNA